MRAPTVFVILLNWNQEGDTRDCLQSLRGASYPARQVIVVDNGSRDGSPERLQAEFPEVQLLTQPTNIGFAAGNNLGIREALARGADLILLLNNDTLVDPGFLEPLVEAMGSSPDMGIVGPKICRYPEQDVLWFAGGRIDWPTGQQFHIGAGEKDRGQHDVPLDVDYVTACCLLARRAVFDLVGLLDPRFFIYFDETAWNVRAARAGFRIRYIPMARVCHKVSAAMKRSSPDTAYYFTRNRLLFLTEYGPRERRWFYRYFYTTRPLRYGADLIRKGHGPQGRAVLQGLWDFYRGRFGAREASG